MKTLLKTVTLSLTTALTLGAGLASANVELGDLSVLSQRGQKLKLALPYGSAPGERVPLLRFTVEDVKVPAGYTAPSPRSFTMSQGEARNLVILQSRELFDAPSVSMIVKVANQTGGMRAYEVRVPNPRLAATEAPPAEAKKVGFKNKAKRSYKRKIQVQNDLPPK